MKKSWLNRKPGYKGLSRGRKPLQRTSRLSTTRTVRRDQGQRAVPTTQKCDSMLSKEVRQRGSWICVRCRASFANRREMLGASHFFNKGTCAALRFDPRNVDPLCHPCHTGSDGWEYQKSYGYLTFMMQKLGTAGYERLMADSMSGIKLEQAKATFIEKFEGGTLWD